MNQKQLTKLIRKSQIRILKINLDEVFSRSGLDSLTFKLYLSRLVKQKRLSRPLLELINGYLLGDYTTNEIEINKF